jgi:formylmethanofuran dehydrogenase subunit E-like metal-binding protein
MVMDRNMLCPGCRPGYKLVYYIKEVHPRKGKKSVHEWEFHSISWLFRKGNFAF